MRFWDRSWRRPCRHTRAEKRRNRGPSLEALEARCLLSTGFTQINLDSDVPGLAPVTDPNLVNPWGISFSPTGAFWFGDNGAGVSDVVDGTGQLLPVVVTIPGSGGSLGTPTGTVYNGGSGFQVTENGVSAPAHFLFASEAGTISAWNPQVDSSSALVMIDNTDQGAVYKGLTLATGTNGQTYLYAADFGQGKIAVFDQNFNPVSSDGSFSDPDLPSGFAPFNVQNINGLLFVTYAKKDTAGDDDVAGAGNGFIDVYTPEGTLVQRLASGGPLNSPWGMAIAPQSFGSLAGALLVGNEGDGHISAYDVGTGAYLGQLTDGSGTPLAIEGLWGLAVGNDHLAGNSQTLYFAAGIDQEQHGLFGAIQNLQSGQSGTGGNLPYDPSSDDDDYPLPPALGPTLANDSGQPAPTPVLLPASTSSLALAPTLSIPSEALEGQGQSALVPSLASPGLATATDSSIPVVAIGTITGPATLSAFSLTSPLELSLPSGSPGGPHACIGSMGNPETLSPSLLTLDYEVPADTADEAEKPLLLISVEERTLPLKKVDPSISEASDVSFDIENMLPMESVMEQRTARSAQVSQQCELGWPGVPPQESRLLPVLETRTRTDESPDVPLRTRLTQGFLLTLVACFRWTSARIPSSPYKTLQLKERRENPMSL